MGTTNRFPKADGENDQHQGGEGKDEERSAPTELGGEQTCRQGAEDYSDGVGRLMKREHLGAVRRGEPVREEGIVGRVVDGLADGRTRPGEAEEHDAGGQARGERTDRPGQRPNHRQSDPGMTVGNAGNRHLKGQRCCIDQGKQGEESLVTEPELVSDLRQQNRPGCTVEFVDGIEAEQDEQRVEGPVAGDAPQGTYGVAQHGQATLKLRDHVEASCSEASRRSGVIPGASMPRRSASRRRPASRNW